VTALVDFASERWYADKDRKPVGIRTLDALGPLQIVEVEFAEGEPALYTRVPERPRWADLLRGARGRFVLEGEPPVAGDGEPLDTDASHSSWRVGDAIVKCYRRLRRGIHPEAEVGRALTELGFPHAPRLRASLEWRPESEAPAAVAVVHDFVPDAEPGWEWGASQAAREDTDFAEGLGTVAAELHGALRSAFGTRVGSAADGAARHAAAMAQLERAVAAAGGLVAGEERRIRRELEPLADPPSLLQRVHGDLHVGQLLHAGGRLYIIDFEGEPGRSLKDRSAPESPLRDLASLLRSLDHCGRYAVRECGADPEPTERWIEDARGQTAAAYGPYDAAELRACEWERAVYEFTYAAAYLPDWLYAPLGGLEALLREPL
jgi:maltokinase